VDAVAFCGGKDALPALQEALNHPDKYVRLSAQSAIDRLNRPPRNMPPPN
jgi:HEAT repeat protein